MKDKILILGIFIMAGLSGMFAQVAYSQQEQRLAIEAQLQTEISHLNYQAAETGLMYADMLAEKDVEINDLQLEIESLNLRIIELENRPPEIITETIYEYKDLRYFNDTEELFAWLAQDNTDGFISFTNGYDCDDYARDLQKAAANDGYLISTELDYILGKLHMINSTIIGNNLYFVEPQTDRFWMRTVLD